LPRELEQDAAALRHGGPSEGDHTGPGGRVDRTGSRLGHERADTIRPTWGACAAAPARRREFCCGFGALPPFRGAQSAETAAKRTGERERAPDRVDPGPFGAAA